MVYYPVPLNKMKVFEGRCEIAGTLECAEKAAQEVLSLPIEPLMEESHRAYICDCIKEFFGKHRD